MPRSIRAPTLGETTVAFWREIMASNLEGPFVLCREAVPRMLEGGGGSIINVGSGNGLGGGPNLVAYSVAKGGLLTLTRNIAGAYGRDNIRANYLNPGWNITETEKVVQAREGHDAAWLADIEAACPAGVSRCRPTPRTPCCGWRPTSRCSSTARSSTPTAAACCRTRARR